MWNTVQVPIGWKGWWLTPNNNHADPNYYSDHPANCYEDQPEGCKAWHNPEYRDSKGTQIGPSRVRSGLDAQKYFTFWSVHEAGLLQTVNVPPGSTVRFSAYMHAWSSNEDMNELKPSTFQSSGQVSMHMRVGIDPTGGDDPWSANVVWSPEHDSYDTFGYYEVRAVAQSDKVTVFTHSMPEKAMKHNDVYVDDAELVAIDGGTAILPAPAPVQSNSQPAAANAPAAVRPTALPRPDGSIVHVVQAGDTVFGLALQYDVSMDSILQLNGLTKESYLQIGQELVIAGATVSPATPTIAPTAAPPSAAAPESTSTPVAIANLNPDAAPANRGLLCVRAFEDTNNDGLYDERNALMQGAIFNVINAQGQNVVSYVSDGVSEPHCFTRLQPGNYTVSIDPASDTVATSDRKWSVTLASGSTIDVNFGARLKSAAAQSPAGTDTSGGPSATLGLAFVVIIAGAGLWMYARRRTGVSRV
jgi:LysM repeat protein